MRKAIVSDKAPRPRGPYSPAIIASGPTVYVSAQGPVDPATDQFVSGNFCPPSRNASSRMSARCCEAAGTSWQHAVKVTVVLADFGNFAAMNRAYANYVTDHFPRARPSRRRSTPTRSA